MSTIKDKVVVITGSTRIIAPLLGGALLQHIGTWAPGAFGAVVMIGVSVYVFVTIYNHPIVFTLKQNQAAAIPAAD